MFRRVLATFALLVSSHAGASPIVAPELELAQAWPFTGPGRFDASGLMIRDGVFFAVSDRHVYTVFKLEFAGEEVRAVPFTTFSGPVPYPWIGYMDIEGIAPAPDGGFLLAPEWGFAVCHVPAGGGTATWVSPDIKAAGQAAGLLVTKDAYLEGIAILGEGHYLLAAERAPRGLIEIAGAPHATRVSAQRMESTRYQIPDGRTPDWSDLCVWRGRVFGLARNQHLVVELIRGDDGAWTEGQAWSFAATENHPGHCFVDMSFGWAEGVAIEDGFIYVLLDSNNLARKGRPDDKRSWLFQFKNPIAH